MFIGLSESQNAYTDLAIFKITYLDDYGLKLLVIRGYGAKTVHTFNAPTRTLICISNLETCGIASM